MCVCYCLGGVVVECPLQVQEDVGLIPQPGHTKDFKMEEMTALLGTQGCGISIKTDWLSSG